MTCRDAIISAMKRQGWSQLALSKASGVQQSAISAFVNGKRDITANTADRLFDSLNIRVVVGGRKRD